MVVLASPLYYWFISGHLKNAFDRLFAIAECDPNYRNPKKECVLLMAALGAGELPVAFLNVCRALFRDLDHDRYLRHGEALFYLSLPVKNRPSMPGPT